MASPSPPGRGAMRIMRMIEINGVRAVFPSPGEG